MGFEGANVLFDTWVHPLMMGLEEHLLGMFREDFEFHAEAAPSHLASVSAAAPAPVPVPAKEESNANREAKVSSASQPAQPAQLVWGADAEAELRKIPFFVRGKAKRNTERFATEHGISKITVETLYDAKAHFSR
jgi:light-independent protochlorophyllide reductase subunit B